MLETLGAVIGLGLLDAYQVDQVAQMGRVLPAIASAMVVAGVILLRFPETHRRELEDIH